LHEETIKKKAKNDSIEKKKERLNLKIKKPFNIVI
jgi:hypothetical protein